MISKAKYIQLVLDNTETIVVDVNNIKNMSLDDVVESHSIFYSSSKEKEIEIRRKCSRFILHLHKKANVFKKNLQGGMNVFDRLNLIPDISYVEYLDSNKQVIDSIDLPWDFDERLYWQNNFQENIVQEDDSLLIIIKRNKKKQKRSSDNE